MTKITPCLWFDDRIDDAIAFYTDTFNDAEVIQLTRHHPDGPAFTAIIELAGQQFFMLNGSGAEPSAFPFTWAVSFMIECADQAEIDRFWNGFVDNGGKPSQCGWCEDRFGLSWQVVPRQMHSTIFGPDKAGAKRATDAMMGMSKLIIADLERAYAG